jgi:hypothetical protein
LANNNSSNSKSSTDSDTDALFDKLDELSMLEEMELSKQANTVAEKEKDPVLASADGWKKGFLGGSKTSKKVDKTNTASTSLSPSVQKASSGVAVDSTSSIANDTKRSTPTASSATNTVSEKTVEKVQTDSTPAVTSLPPAPVRVSKFKQQRQEDQRNTSNGLPNLNKVSSSDVAFTGKIIER